jgi:hypothetical protein
MSCCGSDSRTAALLCRIGLYQWPRIIPRQTLTRIVVSDRLDGLLQVVEIEQTADRKLRNVHLRRYAHLEMKVRRVRLGGHGCLARSHEAIGGDSLLQRRVMVGLVGDSEALLKVCHCHCEVVCLLACQALQSAVLGMHCRDDDERLELVGDEEAVAHVIQHLLVAQCDVLAPNRDVDKVATRIAHDLDLHHVSQHRVVCTELLHGLLLDDANQMGADGASSHLCTELQIGFDVFCVVHLCCLHLMWCVPLLWLWLWLLWLWLWLLWLWLLL